MKKIDVHCHFGLWNLMFSRSSLQALKEDMERFNYTYCIVSHSRAIYSRSFWDVKTGNREMAETCNMDSRIKAYVYLDPLNVEGTVQEIRTYIHNPNFVGVKTRPHQHGLLIDATPYLRVLKEAADYNLPLLLHSNEYKEEFEAIKKVVKELPNLKIILAHSTYKAGEAFVDQPNIYFDNSTADAERSGINLEIFLETVGAERVLYGSDWPMLHPAWAIGKFESIKISDADKRKIYYGNALRIFSRLHSE